jgi:UDP-N-acetylglucosamine:LPS N-acetylglucosamine transferase
LPQNSIAIVLYLRRRRRVLIRNKHVIACLMRILVLRKAYKWLRILFSEVIALKKRVVLVVLGGGGHTAQMRRLVRLLGGAYEYEFVAARNDLLAANEVPQGARLFRVLNPREKDDRNALWAGIKLLFSFVDALAVLLRSRSSVILACGPALAVPLCILGKLFGKKVLYVESWARVKTQSLSGRLVKPFSDLYFVQWRTLQHVPGARYAGRLA